jgi:hypothetical protein
MLDHVVWCILTSVSEEITASIMRVTARGSMLFWNVGHCVPDYMVLHCIRQPSSYLLPWWSKTSPIEITLLRVVQCAFFHLCSELFHHQIHASLMIIICVQTLHLCLTEVVSSFIQIACIYFLILPVSSNFKFGLNHCFSVPWLFCG